MFGESDEAGIGMVIRNSNGKVRVTLSEKIKKPPTVDILELLAAKRVVLFSLETGTTKSVLEGDAETATKALQHGGWESAQGGRLIKDIFAFKDSFLRVFRSLILFSKKMQIRILYLMKQNINMYILR